MKSLLLGLLAETSIHPGAGQSAGFVDLPVAREAATDYPVIVGSSMKGALLDMAFQSAKATAIDNRESEEDARKTARKKVEPVFGTQDKAGNLLVSDARLLLLPVRSLKTQYKWVTCPHLIERLVRDLKRSDVGRVLLPAEWTAESNSSKEEIGKSVHPTTAFEYLSGNEQRYLGAADGSGNDDLFLEERQFSRAPNGDLPPGLTDLIKLLIANEPTARRLGSQLVVVSDNDFVWFARYGLSVNARNVLDDEKKTSKNLWYEETIPPDSIFYCMLAERGGDALKSAEALFESRPYLQVGGNETVGQGWFAVNVIGGANATGGGKNE